PAVHRGAQRIGGGDAHLRVLLLEIATHAAERAAGADGAGEAVDATARLLPDFRPGAAIVAFGVRHVVPLVGPERAHLLCQPFTHVDIVVGILVRHRRHLAQLRATKPQHVLLLLALRVRDDDERTVTTRVTDERAAQESGLYPRTELDAFERRIALRRFRIGRADRPALLRVDEHHVGIQAFGDVALAVEPKTPRRIAAGELGDAAIGKAALCPFGDEPRQQV